MDRKLERPSYVLELLVAASKEPGAEYPSPLCEMLREAIYLVRRSIEDQNPMVVSERKSVGDIAEYRVSSLMLLSVIGKEEGLCLTLSDVCNGLISEYRDQLGSVTVDMLEHVLSVHVRSGDLRRWVPKPKSYPICVPYREDLIAGDWRNRLAPPYAWEVTPQGHRLLVQLREQPGEHYYDKF